MASIHIDDLPASAQLDRRAMAAIRGGGAPWVFGWIRPYVEGTSERAPAINFYQINNYADQMINQFQTVTVNNAGANATLDVNVDERSVNNGLQPPAKG